MNNVQCIRYCMYYIIIFERQKLAHIHKNTNKKGTLKILFFTSTNILRIINNKDVSSIIRQNIRIFRFTSHRCTVSSHNSINKTNRITKIQNNPKQIKTCSVKRQLLWQKYICNWWYMLETIESTLMHKISIAKRQAL